MTNPAARTAIAVLLGTAALLLALLALNTHSYTSAYHQGVTLGSVGFETRGDVGPFAHIPTPLGTVNISAGQASFCPAGATDIECGS